VAAAIPAGLRGVLSASRALVPDAAAALGNPDFDSAPARVLVARLSPWRDVDRSSAHLFLLSEARKALPGAYIDLAFFPDRGDRDLILEAERAESVGLPWFHGLASGRGPADFDLVLVSNAFGLELANLPWLLSTAGLPFRASARVGLHPRPLVILGGSNAAAAGAIVAASGDSLVDGIFFGEGEGALGPLCRILADRGLGAEARLLHAAAEVEGFWAAGSPDRRAVVRRLKESPPPLIDPPPLNSPESGTTRLQVSAGCPSLCSFCFEGWDRRPYRERPLADILAAAKELKRNTGADRLEVYSFNFNTHEDVAGLILGLGQVFRRVNLMSQRLDILADTPGLLAAEMAGDKRSFTLGIEGISERMRAYYRKGLDRAKLDRLFDLLLRPGIKELKLFYILSGLETEEDLGEFSAFARRLGAARDDRAPGLRLLASAGYLVRIPRTPLQYAPLALDRAALEVLAASVEASCEEAGIEFRLAVDFADYAADQLISLAGGGLLGWLETLPGRGFVYDGSLSKGAWPSMRAFAEAEGLLGPAFLGEKGPDYRPPLPFLDETPGLLYAEYLKAKSGEDRQACLGEDCCGCGACPDAEAVAGITGHRIEAPGAELIAKIGRLTAAKAAFTPLYAEVELPDGLAGATEAYAGAWLMRRLLAVSAGAELSLFEAREALFSGNEAFGIPEGFYGRTVFALFGPKKERLAGLCAAAGLLVLETLPRPATVEVELWLPGASSGAGGEEGAEDVAIKAFRDWALALHVPCIEKALDQGREFLAAGKDSRKAAFASARFAFSPEGTKVALNLAAKADLAGFLSRLGPTARAAGIRILRY
jgi:hypothetical protein